MFRELPARDLLVLSEASKFLYVFVQTDALWKEMYLDAYEGDIDFVGSWKESYIRKKTGRNEIPPSAEIRAKGIS